MDDLQEGCDKLEVNDDLFDIQTLSSRGGQTRNMLLFAYDYRFKNQIAILG